MGELIACKEESLVELVYWEAYLLICFLNLGIIVFSSAIALSHNVESSCQWTS